MRLRKFLTKSTRDKKRLNFSAILTKGYFNDNLIQIQMALNKDHMLPSDYLIRRTKPKINSALKIKPKKIDEDISMDSYRIHLDKKNIPYQLEKILVKAKKDFAIQRNKYLSLKIENKVGLGFWHFVDEMRKKNNKEKKYLQDDIDKNSINLYSDKVQQLSENLFRLNPLLITKEHIDLFFFYLGEFNKYYSNVEKYNNIKKKVIDFLERLKEFLDYVEIKADSTIDTIGKEIKILNSKYIKGLNMRIKTELKNMKIKEKKLYIREIKSAKKNIKSTQKTLDSINKDKHFFDDPIYFDPDYHSSYPILKKNKFKTRNKLYTNKKRFALTMQSFTKNINIMNQTNKISTASTGFFTKDKKNIKRIKNITDVENIKTKDDTTNDEPKMNFQKIKIRQKLFNKRVSSALNFPNNKLILKNNDIKIKRTRNISQEKIESKKNSEMNSITSSFNNNLEQNKLNKFHISSARRKSIQSLKQNLEENPIKLKILPPEKNLVSKSGLTPIVKINKHILKKRTFNNIMTKNDFKFNPKNAEIEIKLKDTKVRSSFASSNSISNKNHRNSKEILIKDKKKEKIKLKNLYENLKIKKIITMNDLNDIKTYFNERGKNIRNSLKLMDIISRLKNTISNYDIEQKTKKITQSNLTFEQKEKLQEIKDINKIMDNLDVHYMTHYFDFKSRLLCENNKIKE